MELYDLQIKKPINIDYTIDENFMQIDFSAVSIPKKSYENWIFNSCNFTSADIGDFIFKDCTFNNCSLSKK